jgi:hypothetical protein
VYNDYSYTAASQAVLTSPAPGSTLASANVAFGWTAAANATGYYLWIGSTGVGSNNLYNSAEKTGTSYSFNSMPTNGETVYVRLTTNYGGTWVHNDYIYTAASQAVLTSPAPASTLTGASVNFAWTSAPNATGYYLLIGSTGVGSNNLYNSQEKTGTSYTFNSMPTNGESVFVRLITNYSGTWAYNDYTYTATGSLSQLNGLSCGTPAMTGIGTVSCSVTLNAAAPGTGLSVNLSTNDSAVTLPSTVVVPANATTAGFAATLAPVGTRQSAYLMAKSGSVTKTFALQLNATVPTIVVATSDPTITYGTAVTFTATLSSGPVGSLIFYDGATAIGAGTIIGTTATLTTSSLSAGSHTISANWPGNNSYAAVTSAAITQVINKATPAVSWTAPAPISYGTALSAMQLDASSAVAGTFSYSPAPGSVPKAGAHTLSVTFTPADATDYATATASVALTVNQATPTIVWNAPSAISYGTALSATQLDASSSVAGAYTYTPAVGTVLKAGVQTLAVTFTPTDSTDYTTPQSSVSITVNAATPAITWPAPSAITYGTALGTNQLDATSSTPGTFAYSPAAGTVLGAGQRTLSVTFTPADTTDFTTVSTSTSITVSAATPAITWPAPAAIIYGTALSSSQLDATSTVPGTFAYSPAAGAVLAVGSQTLSVVFTPNDTTDYATATTTVTLMVNPGTATLTINAASVPFGSVTLNSPTTQDITLTSTGTAPVTVNSATVTGTGFTLSSAPAFPVTLAPGQATTLGIEFDPTTPGSAAGQLTISSNSSTNGAEVVSLTGTGTQPSYAVDLSWDAPSSSPDPIAGYDVFRAPSGSITYQLLNSTVDSQTAFVDNTVESGQSYDYIVESVDDSGLQSVPTSPVAVTIP